MMPEVSVAQERFPDPDRQILSPLPGHGKVPGLVTAAPNTAPTSGFRTFSSRADFDLCPFWAFSIGVSRAVDVDVASKGTTGHSD